MDELEFTAHLHSGSGKPFIYAQSNDLSPFRDAILDACLHCYSVDPQSEGTRAGYMLELVDLMPDADFFKNKVLHSLSEGGDNWDTVQRFHFATYMAMDGDPQARQAIYNHFKPGPELGQEIAIDFLRLDGIEGLHFAAAKLGALLLTKSGKVGLSHFWHQAEEICGEQEAFTALTEAALTDPRVEAFLTALNTKHTEANPPIPRSYEALLQAFPRLSNFQLVRWGEKASPADLEAAARVLLQAQSPEEQRKHLRIFFRTPFPLAPEPLIPLAWSKDEKLAEAATRALGKITNPAVRDLAFQLVAEQNEGRQEAISMLNQNFFPGDHRVVLGWFKNETDRYIRHGMQIDLRAFWKDHPEPESESDMLRSIYNLGPCSACREFVVRRLIELDALSPEMHRECAHDTSQQIVELVAEQAELTIPADPK